MITKRLARLHPARRVSALVGAALLTAAGVAAVVSPAAAAPTDSTALLGKTVFLDPGHQGSAAGHDLDRPVPDGRGGTKPCQTTGATSVTGVAEHTINWQIAQQVKAGLESQGARVVLSRPDDTGWGGCVDERAAAASQSGAAVAVSLHADSTSEGADPTDRGFHLIVPTLPLPDAAANTAQSGNGRLASTTMRDAFVRAGFPAANYAGVQNGIQTRSDIAAVNLTTVPAVFIEMGNLSNPTEAAALSSGGGQLKYSMAITEGIVNYVKGATPQTLNNVPETPTTPGTTTDPDLSAVLPFVQKLLNTSDPVAIAQLLLTEGQDVSAEVINAMLSVIYGLFGGTLPTS
ncbi:MAG: N-acetylmuramoyl-L-alanine amidase [Gordonia sp. (in: high G+C Gram-positive bacteria)]